MNVLFDPNPFCFGSTATMRAILAALPPVVSARVMAMGPVLDLCADLDVVQHDMRDATALAGRPDLLRWADVYVAISNNTNVETVHDAGVPLVFIDALYWMKRRETAAMRVADAYLIENYPGVDERLRALPVRGARRIGPILHPVERRERPDSGLLVNIGGAASPDLSPGINTAYPQRVVAVVESIRADHRWPRVEVAMGSAAAASTSPVGETRAVTLAQPEYLFRLGGASALLTAPGLNAPLEAFHGGVPVAWLPPQNLTQVFHLRAYVDAGLAPEGLLLEQLVPGFAVDPRGPEADGTRSVLAALASLGDSGWREVRVRVGAELERVLRDPVAQVRRQRAWLDSLGADGAREAARVICEVGR